jgi:hypothetical protein
MFNTDASQLRDVSHARNQQRQTHVYSGQRVVRAGLDVNAPAGHIAGVEAQHLCAFGAARANSSR